MLGNGPVRFGRRALEKDPLSRHLASAPPHHPNGCGALLEIAGLVHHQHRPRIAQVVDDVVADVIAQLVVVPHRPAKQVLHPVRVGVAGVLGDRPAVHAGQVGQQAAHERPGPPPQLHPAKPTRDPAQQLVKQLLPLGRVDVYAVACGHRLIFGCPHTTRSSTVAALLCSSTLAAPTSQVTNYRWSTSEASPRTAEMSGSGWKTAAGLVHPRALDPGRGGWVWGCGS